MIFAVILAGGTGSRMGSNDMPKQYLEIKGKPIINHTIEKFLPNPRFEKIIVLSPKKWVHHTKEIIRKYTGKTDRIAVIEGGDTRNETIMNAVRYIEENDGLDDDTVIVTHDAVRPVVTSGIIDGNIRYAVEYGATDTVVAATDTIVESVDKQTISNIPDRKMMYQGQTPQSFKAKKLKELYESLTDDEKDILTDACKIFSMKGCPVHLVRGEVHNIKITYPYDLRVAKALLDEEIK